MIVVDKELCVSALNAVVADMVADGIEINDETIASAVYAAGTVAGKDDSRSVTEQAALQFCAELHPDIFATGDEWIARHWAGAFLPLGLHAQILARWCIENASIGFLHRFVRNGSYVFAGQSV